jgi:hypothetical protein
LKVDLTDSSDTLCSDLLMSDGATRGIQCLIINHGKAERVDFLSCARDSCSLFFASTSMDYFLVSAARLPSEPDAIRGRESENDVPERRQRRTEEEGVQTMIQLQAERQEWEAVGNSMCAT